MTDGNHNDSHCVIDISEDNLDKGFKEDEQLRKKYFNGDKVVLTKIIETSKKKKIHISKRPLVIYILLL